MRKNQMRFIKIAIIAVPVFIATMIAGADCYAYSKYVGRYEACMSSITAGVLDELYEIDHGKSAKEYMCSEAAANWNTCSLWIGSAASATVPTITVNSESGTATVMYWGTCTDYANPTARVWVDDDNGAIDDAKTVNRLGYPAFGSAATTLDIGRFISGAAVEEVNECETRYTRTIIVGRTHSGRDSSSQVRQTLTVRVVKNESECSEGSTCDDWMPSSYPASNMYHGVTTVDIRIQNERFGGWRDNDIWAMPTDRISWIACYYPGVQRTSDTDTGSLNGADLGYPLDYDGFFLGYRGANMPRNACMRNMPVAIVEWEPLYVKVNKVSEWQNKLIMTGDADEEYEGIWARGDDTVRYNIVSKQTHEGDAGETFTETAITGTPVEATIDVHNPTTDFTACTCESWRCIAPGWNDDLGACTGHNNPNNPYECTSHEGDWDWSPGYCREDTWDTYGCSCCTGGNFATTGNSGIDGLAPCRGDMAHCQTGTVNSYERTLNDATVVFGPVSDSLSVRLPYNFTTSTDLSIDRSLVYSGSPNAIRVSSVTASVHTRYNGVTIADYATQVPGATIFLYAYVTSDGGGGGFGGSLGGTNNICEITDTKQCVELESTGQTLNAGGSLGGSTDTIWSGLTYNAFDAAAGDYMCFASSVSPYTVAGDTDMAGGDGVWTYSSPKCAIIAKRPIFQVWGGSMYSVGNIVATYNNKVNIYNEYKSDVQSNWKRNGGTSIYFTPWVEESLVLKNGTTNTLASGAASALNSNVAGVGTSTVFCNDRAALSFANYSGTIGSLCNGAGTVGASGIDSGIKNREDLIKYWVGTGALSAANTGAGTTFNLTYPNSVGTTITSATGSRVRYAYSTGDINLYGTVPQGTTYLIKSDGTVNITSDLKYNNGYTDFSQIPKVIIYAQNVNISCNVNEVDAIIVTKNGGSMDTCAGSNDQNDGARSRQLKIFGMVIADSVSLKRSYGAAANNGNMTDAIGTPSDGAAAEIFDYDSSIFMWSEFMAGSQESDTLQTVYQHELAPRY